MHISTMNFNTRRAVDKKTSKSGHHLQGAMTGRHHSYSDKSQSSYTDCALFTAISVHSIGKIPSLHVIKTNDFTCCR